MSKNIFNSKSQRKFFPAVLEAIVKPFLYIEKFFYILRDLVWKYPDIILENNKYRDSFFRTYSVLVPYSHFILAILLLSIFLIIFFSGTYNRVVSAAGSELIEGVVMGADNYGRPQRINKVDPFAPVTVQLEKDLVDLIYEPLFRLDLEPKDKGTGSNESVTPILAEEILSIRPGADYQFNLRSDVFWQDGEKFTTDDVIRTFDIVSNLRKSDNSYTVALKQLKWEKIDDYSFRICTKGASNDERCSKTQDNPILSNFLELISVKIVPEHLTANLDPGNYDIVFHEILRSPVGTGKYKLFAADDTSVTLNRNNDYYKLEEIPQIEFIKFKYYITFKEAIAGLKSGEIHSLAASTSEERSDVSNYHYIEPQLSPVLYNQYWGVYFNLRLDPNGNSIAPEFLQDKNIRQAISMAINREEIIQNALMGAAEEAYGPISVNSLYFNPNAGWKTYNLQKASELLDAAGWTIKNGATIRTNRDNLPMEFSLYFLESYDRDNIATIIEQDLLRVGIKVIINRQEQQENLSNARNTPKGWSLEELTSQVLAPRAFDALIFGMNTFIDPDRFELFHSSQTDYPKLNIAGYVGSDETVKVRENKSEGESSVIRVPRVDKLLETARSYDPKSGIDERKADYFKIQELIAEDSPVVFLYNPRFIYYHNSKLRNVNLESVNSIEDRFKNIHEWLLEY